MTIDLTEEEAEAYLADLQGTLGRLREQEDDLKACIRHLRRQPTGEENGDPDGNEIRIRGLEFDIDVTRELIGKYEQDIRDLENARRID